MSKNDINFLPQRKEALAKRRLANQLKKITVVVVVIYSIFVFCLMVFSLLIGNKEKKILTDTSVAEKQIQSLKDQENILVGLKSKASKISEIFKDKNNIADLLGKINENKPEGIEYSGISIKNNKILINGTARNALIVTDYIQQVKNNETKFSSVILNGVTRIKNGLYAFALEIVI